MILYAVYFMLDKLYMYHVFVCSLFFLAVGLSDKIIVVIVLSLIALGFQISK